MILASGISLNETHFTYKLRILHVYIVYKAPIKYFCIHLTLIGPFIHLTLIVILQGVWHELRSEVVFLKFFTKSFETNLGNREM